MRHIGHQAMRTCRSPLAFCNLLTLDQYYFPLGCKPLFSDGVAGRPADVLFASGLKQHRGIEPLQVNVIPRGGHNRVIKELAELQTL